MLTLLASLAFADNITLDTGATIGADLARYEADGDCQLSVTEGDLLGVIVILPCSRIVAFQRTEHAAPVVVGLVMPLDMPVSGAVTEEEAVAPVMPDSVAALSRDDFVTPLPVADPEYEAEAVEDPDDAEEGQEAGDEPDSGAGEEAVPTVGIPSAVHAAPSMPPVGTKSLSF